MNRSQNRYAATDSNGRLVALVADGPADLWPADGAEGLATIEDDAVLGQLAGEYLTEFDQLAGAPDGDLERLAELRDRIVALGSEAARRFAAATAADDDTPPADPPAPADDGLSADQRAERIAALRAGFDAPPAGGGSVDGGNAEDAIVEGAPLRVVSLSPEQFSEALAAAATAAATTTAALVAEQRPAPADTAPGRVSAAALSGFRPPNLAPNAAEGATRGARLPARLVTSADVPNHQMGAEIDSMTDLVEAFVARHGALGHSTGTNDEKIPVATLAVDVPDDIDIRGARDWRDVRDKVMSKVGPEAMGVDPWTNKEALVASGGLAAPVEPYYGQLVIAQSARPVLEALPTFVADHGGIRLVLPPSIGSLQSATQPGAFSDGVSTADPTFTSATAAFTGADVGAYIVQTDGGTNIPAGTQVASVNSGTSVELTVTTVGSATGIHFRLSSRNPYNLGAPVGIVTAAQDAAGPPGTVKFTFDVPNGTQVEHDVYSVYTSLQFANLTGRTYPEQVEANIRVADALAARVAETNALDYITAWSTLFTGAKTFGSARQLLAQLGHMAAFYRNSERMDPMAVLRVGLPAWAINNMRGDYLSTFIGGGAANWGLSDDEIAGFFQEHRLIPFFYQDGPSDVSQLFTTSALGGATNTGTNVATPIPIPDYPGSGATTSFRTKVVSFMWAEGTWLGLTTGELNLGLVRDSVLNSQNRFRNFQEVWETPAFVGTRSLRAVHTVAADGTYGAAASITLGVGSGI